MAGVRRVILFALGVLCLIGSLAEDPIHVWSMVVGLLLMGVLTWEQIEGWFGRNGHHNTPDATKPPSPG